MKTFTVREEIDLKTFTDNTYAQGSFWFRTLLKKKDIRVNGKKTDRNLLLNKGDVVSYYLSSDKEQTPAFYDVYEDENILIIDKESGVNSEAVYAALQEREARFIHRLDRNTKGLMIFALNAETEQELLRLFKERQVEKRYHAVVCGEVEKEHETLTAYLLKNAEDSTVRVMDEKRKGAESIVTEYRKLKAENGFSLLEITLHTGKTHQIRAHMSHISHPVLGDTKYGNKEMNEKLSATRQYLIAKSLEIFSDGVLSYLKGKKFISRFSFEIPQTE